jgi:hypothetical protein
MSDPFDSGTAGISLALDVPFPANVESGPGIQVDKTSGVWIVGLDYPPLVDGGSPANPSTVYLAAYDSGLQIYERLRLDNIIAGATGLDSRTPRGDADYTILVGDRYVALTGALTAVRTWTLPPAASVPGGRVVTIQDEAGGISGQSHLNLVPTGADTIDGLGNYRLKAKFGGLALRSDGSSKWSVVYSWQVTLIADANYTVQQGDLTVAYSSITAPRVIALPLANAYPSGQRLTIIDFSGSCTATNNIAIARAGADTINGATSQSITQAYGYLALVSDGVSKWTIVDSSVVSGSQVIGPLPTPRLFRGYDVATNMSIVASVASNILTVALKDGTGAADPSPASPIYLPIRDPTAANGDLIFMTIAAATSIVAPVGATFGAANSQPFRLWLVGFNDAGTFRLGLINCLTIGPPTSIYPLRAFSNQGGTSTLIGAGSTAAQTFYTAGAGVAGKAFQILGYLEWLSGLATAGTYSAGPSRIQLFGPGVATPGEMVGNAVTNAPNTSGGSTTSLTMVDVANSSVTISLTSSCNVVRYDFAWMGQVQAAGAATNSNYFGQVVRGAGPTLLWGPGVLGVVSGSGTNMQTQASQSATGLDPLLSSSATTYKLQNRTSIATGAAQTLFINAMLQEVMA